MLDITFTTYKAWEKAGWFPKARREPQSNFRVFDEEELAEGSSRPKWVKIWG
jgi:hypothetical protein